MSAHNNYEEYQEAKCDLMLTEARCPFCGKYLFCSDIEEYDYVCVDCDENFYECEVE